MLRLDKPMKRGTRVKIGNANPCWIPVTYERLPSFCYYCGKLGHTYKDCDSLHDHEVEDIDVEKFPYGDWMRSSRLKNIQVVTGNDGENRDSLRRSLFRQKYPTEGNSDDRSKEKQVDKSEQLSDIMRDLQKVHVGKEDQTTHVAPIDTTSGMIQNTSLPRPLHPTTKTVTQALNTVDPISEPSLIPISDLINMVTFQQKLFIDPPDTHIHPSDEELEAKHQPSTRITPQPHFINTTMPLSHANHTQTMDPPLNKTTSHYPMTQITTQPSKPLTTTSVPVKKRKKL